MTVAAVILAADEGADFTSPKYLADVGGETMIRSTTRPMVDWNVDARFVVVGPDAEVVAEEIAGEDVSTVLDPEWSEGTASPVRVAIDLISRDRSVSHIVFARGDQPGVSSDVVNELIAVATDTEADAVLPKYRYARGWPVVVGASLFARLLGSEGDLDLHSFLSMHAATIEERWFDQLEPRAIESPDDLPGRHR